METEIPLRFRNYKPRDAKLIQYIVAEPTLKLLEEKIDKDAAKAVASFQTENVLNRINPEKPNWDLKRDVERRMRILTHKTDEAIVKLIKAKVAESKVATAIRENLADDNPKATENAKETLSAEEVEIGAAVSHALEEILVDEVESDSDVDTETPVPM